jgi:hypothetical protein
LTCTLSTCPATTTSNEQHFLSNPHQLLNSADERAVIRWQPGQTTVAPFWTDRVFRGQGPTTVIPAHDHWNPLAHA